MTAEQVDEQRKKDLNEALEELKQEFERLMENEGKEPDDKSK
jgi:ElaB/YqjD/DUF883 family membrane-anchored ribosome-binding protein